MEKFLASWIDKRTRDIERVVVSAKSKPDAILKARPPKPGMELSSMEPYRFKRGVGLGVSGLYRDLPGAPKKKMTAALVSGTWYSVSRIYRAAGSWEDNPWWFIGVASGFDISRYLVQSKSVEDAIEELEERKILKTDPETGEMEDEIRIASRASRVVHGHQSGYDRVLVTSKGERIEVE
jgi:hypothetical protein